MREFKEFALFFATFVVASYAMALFFGALVSVIP